MCSLRVFHILILFLPFLFSACEKASTPPEVTFIAPAEGFKAGPGDTLEVKVKAVQGDAELNKLHLVILDDAHRQALPSVSYELNGVPGTDQSFFYPITRSPSDDAPYHELRAILEDEEGERNSAYVKGSVNRAPLRFEKAFAVTRPSHDRVEVHELREGEGMPSLFLDLQGDFSGSSLNSPEGELLIAGSETAPLRAYDPYGGTLLWERENQGSGPNPFFLDAIGNSDGEEVLVPLGTGRLQVFDGGEGPVHTVEALDGHLIEEAALSAERILTGQPDQGNDPYEWVVYYPSTGAIGDQAQIPNAEVVGILPEDDDRVMVLMNESGQGKLKRYHIPTGSFNIVADPPPGALLDGVRIDGGRLLLVHEQGVYIYRSNGGTMPKLYSSVPQDIAFDPVEGRLFSAEGKQLRVRELDQGNVMESYSFQDSIRGVEVLLGR